jgi:hypothetical protein
MKFGIQKTLTEGKEGEEEKEEGMKVAIRKWRI